MAVQDMTPKDKTEPKTSEQKEYRRTLIIDDNTMNLKATKLIFTQKLGKSQIQTSNSGLEGILLFKERVQEIKDVMKKIYEMQGDIEGGLESTLQKVPPLYELLIIDYSMPETRGPQVSMEVR